MKTLKQIIIFLSIIGLISCKHKPTKEITRKFENGSPRFIRIYSDKEKDSLTYFAQQFYENGQLDVEGLLKNKVQEGEWTWYWQNGKIKDKAEFKNGKYVNKKLHYNSDGTIHYEEFLPSSGCEDDACDCADKVVYYYPNGKVNEIQVRVNRKYNGTLVFYYQNGQKGAETKFENGLQEGEAIRWDSTGTLIEKKMYHNDSLVEIIK